MKLRKIESIPRAQIHFWVGLLLCLLVIFLRIPSLSEPLYHRDEAMHFFLGDGIRQGLQLYTQVFDNKPPLIYLLAAMSKELFGLKLIVLGLSILGTLAFYTLGKKLIGDHPLALTIATLVYIVISNFPYFEGNTVNGELLIIHLQMLGLYSLGKGIGFSIKRGWVILSGILFGLSLLTKLPAVFTFFIVPVFVEQVVVGDRRKLLKSLQYFYLSAFTMVLTVLVVTGMLSNTNAFLDALFIHNFHYADQYFLHSLWPKLVFGWYGRLSLGIVIVGLLGYFRKSTRKVRFSLLYFYSVLLGASLSFRPYTHYFLLLAPGLALLTAYLFVSREWISRLLIAGCLGLSLLFWHGFEFTGYRNIDYYQNYFDYVAGRKSLNAYQLWFDRTMERHLAISRYLRSRYKSGTTAFLYTDDPMLYHLAKLKPVSRYGVAYHLLERNAWLEVEQTLKTQLPCLLVIDNNIPDFEFLETLTSHSYTPIKQIESQIIFENTTCKNSTNSV